MSDEDLNDEALKLFNAASELDPRKSKFGVMTVDSSLGAYNIWCFLWFQTEPEAGSTPFVCHLSCFADPTVDQNAGCSPCGP